VGRAGDVAAVTTLSVNIQKQLGDFTLDAAFTGAGGVTALFGAPGAARPA
jgi:ABC-type molybdate transport system ATPase subunit